MLGNPLVRFWEGCGARPMLGGWGYHWEIQVMIIPTLSL